MRLMPRLSGVYLAVPDPAELVKFYRDVLGMSAVETPQGWRLGYPGLGADIVLRSGGTDYSHRPTDRYWKIGITVPDVDTARAQLANAGIEVSTPHQFRDIGYMCHLTDPAGFQIELLQHDFEGNRPPNAGDRAKQLGGGARIGQISLRCGDINAARANLEALGLKLLSVQPVADLGFTLYFWAFTDENPPNPDLSAVNNREWLWKRPYTLLELQHREGQSPTRNPGYLGLELDGLQGPATDDFGDHIRSNLP